MRAAADALLARLRTRPSVLLVLGSGLGALADEMADAERVPFEEIPGFPPPRVEGHRGLLVAGELEGVRCLALQGRFHLYEGHGAATAALPVRVARALGAATLVVTNAAGGLNAALRPGDLMLIEDHINLMARNPLVGPVHPGETRFPDMSQAYDPELRALAAAVAEERGVTLRRGVYCAALGPSYETPAEVRMLQRLGGDAVGMSTVPEVLAARAVGMRVLGISLISNPAAGLLPEPLRHEDVVAAGREAAGRFSALVRGILAALPA
ncbi:MAG TPA: purine-nucleoside phosphorylase [Longimicrobiales bacterium]|nr:purine-nucleoside phosphorylase [Longimicrobiales bacterium]